MFLNSHICYSNKNFFFVVKCVCCCLCPDIVEIWYTIGLGIYGYDIRLGIFNAFYFFKTFKFDKNNFYIIVKFLK